MASFKLKDGTVINTDAIQAISNSNVIKTGRKNYISDPDEITQILKRIEDRDLAKQTIYLTKAIRDLTELLRYRLH